LFEPCAALQRHVGMYRRRACGTSPGSTNRQGGGQKHRASYHHKLHLLIFASATERPPPRAHIPLNKRRWNAFPVVVRPGGVRDHHRAMKRIRDKERPPCAGGLCLRRGSVRRRSLISPVSGTPPARIGGEPGLTTRAGVATTSEATIARRTRVAVVAGAIIGARRAPATMVSAAVLHGFGALVSALLRATAPGGRSRRHKG
jgi:hypothetical protein